MHQADLNLLRTFLAVYRTGSFTAAAPHLGLSQPTVTTQIRTLEKQIERDLFRRLPRGVEPTPHAHELAARIAVPLDALAALDQTTPKVVHLAGPSELLCVRVLPALAPLIAEGLELRITQGLPDQLLDDMRTGRHDLIITTRRPTGRGLESTPLADEEYLLVAAPAWAEHGDLHDIPLIAYAEDLPIVRRYWRTTGHKGGQAAVTVPNLYAVLSAVTAGAGYSVLPRSLCQDHLAEGRLILLHDPEEPR